jgi:hypothetical protein
MLLKLTKIGVATLLAFLAFISTTTGPSLVSTAEAASCTTHGSTRWVYEGCCVNSTKYRLQWCSHGTWVNTTTTDCRNLCMM